MGAAKGSPTPSAACVVVSAGLALIGAARWSSQRAEDGAEAVVQPVQVLLVEVSYERVEKVVNVAAGQGAGSEVHDALKLAGAGFVCLNNRTATTKSQ